MPSGRRPRLTDWASDRYSQNGEDGMLAEVLRRLDVSDGLCVDVGAHDGLTFSNTACLWHDRGWRALLVEPDALRFRDLERRTAGTRAVAVRAAVRPSGDTSVGRLLDAAGLGRDVDLISIDVDNDDVAILRGLADVRCRVIVCEYNATIPHHVDLEGALGAEIGCSLGTLVAAAAALGHELVGVTGTNAIFVSADDAVRFDDLDTEPATIAPTTAYTYVVSDHLGRAVIVGPMPYRFRPGRIALRDGSLVRKDVRVRWTARGLLGAVAWKSGTVRDHLGGLPRGDRLAFLLGWVRSRIRRR